MAKKTSHQRAVIDRLRATGLVFKRLEDFAPETIRAANRSAFPEMRSILLPPQIIRNSLDQPLLRDLLITRIGYASRQVGHYIPRPQGSLDHIMMLCNKGNGWLRIGDREWQVGPATLFCLPANVPHWYGAAADEPWSTYWIHFSGRQAADYFRFLEVTLDRPLLHLGSYDELTAIFEETWSVMKLVHMWENLVRGSIHLSRFLGLLREQRQRPDQRSRDREEAVEKSVRFMTSHLTAELGLAELAGVSEMSVSRYTVEFRRRNGCSPIEFLNRLRMQRACELLRGTQETVRQIAGDVGFADPYYFSRAFKKVAGCSPLAFRKGQGGWRKRHDRQD